MITVLIIGALAFAIYLFVKAKEENDEIERHTSTDQKIRAGHYEYSCDSPVLVVAKAKKQNKRRASKANSGGKKRRSQ